MAFIHLTDRLLLCRHGSRNVPALRLVGRKEIPQLAASDYSGCLARHPIFLLQPIQAPPLDNRYPDSIELLARSRDHQLGEFPRLAHGLFVTGDGLLRFRDVLIAKRVSASKRGFSCTAPTRPCPSQSLREGTPGCLCAAWRSCSKSSSAARQTRRACL